MTSSMINVFQLKQRALTLLTFNVILLAFLVPHSVLAATQGSFGSSSSASLKMTLIIPPRTDSASLQSSGISQQKSLIQTPLLFPQIDRHCSRETNLLATNPLQVSTIALELINNPLQLSIDDAVRIFCSHQSASPLIEKHLSSKSSLSDQPATLLFSAI